MKREKHFIYFAAVCAFITGLTTIAIHQIHVPYGSFEENVQLYKNNAYRWLNWIILFHCLMVLISMLGMALIIEKTSRALAILGFLFFVLFVFSEWQRTLGSLWHIDGLSRRYMAEKDADVRQFLQYEIRHRLYQSNVYFLLFTIGFTLGNASYGIALISNKTIDRVLGAALLLWACCTTLSFISDFAPAKWMGSIIDICNKFYQPLIRLFIGFWLFKKAKNAALKIPC